MLSGLSTTVSDAFQRGLDDFLHGSKYLIFGNKTVFLVNNLANVDHISMNMRDTRSIKVFKSFPSSKNLMEELSCP